MNHLTEPNISSGQDSVQMEQDGENKSVRRPGTGGGLAGGWLVQTLKSTND